MRPRASWATPDMRQPEARALLSIAVNIRERTVGPKVPAELLSKRCAATWQSQLREVREEQQRRALDEFIGR
ncbi:hypothetical protein [Streptomyces agglomeratus]|uniref:hypothetical protein n=1 Tax=Streptomyces agglomeratus TaxID=285458 RepID=UPI000854AEC4|nr:hypothetical protein [Streptomyces agglomeratus]OEJ49623.1 hypothetical protein BGK72_01155 [Streptomyces agglomeratus]